MYLILNNHKLSFLNQKEGLTDCQSYSNAEAQQNISLKLSLLLAAMKCSHIACKLHSNLNLVLFGF